MIEYRVDVENEQLARNMKAWERQLPGFVRLLLERFSNKLVANSQEKVGEVLTVRTGRLRTSIFGRMRGTDTLDIGAGSNVKYARIHELGGIIKAKNAPYLTFPVNGRWVSTKQVEIPARPYVRPSIEEFFRGGGAEDVARGVFNQQKRRYGFE